MNDEIIQHHFDVVFNALQDRENFEIFTGVKKVTAPKVKKTLVNIVRSPTQNRPETPTSVRNTTSKHSQTSTDTESLTSGFSLVSKSGRRRRSYNICPDIPGNRQTSSGSIAGKLYFLPSHDERKKISNRNTLFECRYCGRYILGDFLDIHEETCGNESMSKKY